MTTASIQTLHTLVKTIGNDAPAFDWGQALERDSEALDALSDALVSITDSEALQRDMAGRCTDNEYALLHIAHRMMTAARDDAVTQALVDAWLMGGSLAVLDQPLSLREFELHQFADTAVESYAVGRW